MGLPFSQSHTEKINEIITSNPSVFSQGDAPGIFIAPFIYNMEDAFAAADVVISRAGAISISEIAVVGKPSVLVPSPNVTDDHQTKNARVLSDMDAAVLITDQEAPEKLIDAAIALLKDTKKQAEMQEKLNSIAKPQATETIVNLIESCLQKGA
jgi:UDP-N-acetylglucosamine--N-acetylmuramyl-(pentapeptide) pyrophosphoryl-undecaprenol N-acetylglucosamine transferase